MTCVILANKTKEGLARDKLLIGVKQKKFWKQKEIKLES